MRIVFIAIVLIIGACRSETGLRTLDVTTQVDIKLPADALYGNVSSFSGFHSAVPDLFLEETVEEVGGKLTRSLKLSGNTVLIDELIEVDDVLRSIKYKTISTSLPVKEITHWMEIKQLEDQKSQVIWKSNMVVENQYRDIINERLTGIQESYLFSLELIGEELDQLLLDPDF